MSRRRRGKASRVGAALVLVLGVLWTISCYSQVIKFNNWNLGWHQAAAQGHADATPEVVAQKTANNTADARRWAAAGLPGIWLAFAGGIAVAMLYRPRGGRVVVSSRYLIKQEHADQSAADR